jgi:hypothetical protein
VQYCRIWTCRGRCCRMRPRTWLPGPRGPHSDYFLSESTSALNMTGVVEGSSVSLFVQDVEHSTYLGTKVLQSPIEDTPENYANGKLEPTDIASLE